jgi:hypothetical protein
VLRSISLPTTIPFGPLKVESPLLPVHQTLSIDLEICALPKFHFLLAYNAATHAQGISEILKQETRKKEVGTVQELRQYELDVSVIIISDDDSVFRFAHPAPISGSCRSRNATTYRLICDEALQVWSSLSL